MGIFYVEKDDKTVDGNTFCDGRKCTSADTIIIRGGARGNLLFKNFDGDGSYIPIMNENGASKVEITNDATIGYGVLSLSKCKYIDLRGNNDGDFTYGIHVRNCDPARAHAVWVYGESDHIKLGYLEADCIGNTSISSSGIHVGDGNLSSAWIFDTFEISHNYVHDIRYAGMYLGHNYPGSNNDPYVGTFSIHNNLIEDMGAYGITFKGVKAANNYIYDNTVRTTGLVRDDLTDNFKQGIGVQMFDSGYIAEIYNNRIENTIGPGIKSAATGHLIHDNEICGCGTGNDSKYGHGIYVYSSGTGIHIYDNIIIQPTRYGIYALGTATALGTTLSRNLIGDAGLGEWSEEVAGKITESTGADANIYHADVADFGFKAWSDDGNYGNDDFSFPIPSAKGQIVNLDHPVSVEHGAACDINAAIKNIGELSGQFKTQILLDGVLKATSSEFTLAGGATSTDKIKPFTAPLTGESMDIIIKCIRRE